MGIKIVLPVCDVDLHQVESLAWRMKQLEDYDNIAVVATWAANWDVDHLLKMIEPQWYHAIQDSNEMGWPEASNHLFYRTALFLREQGNTDPWFFMEGDCLPLKKGWRQALETEYEKAGKPYMGVVTDTVYMDTATKRRWTEGKHMVGAGIYPADFLTRCQGIHTVDRHAWDVVIGDEILEDVHHTDLICHRWQTQNYRYNEEGLLIMDDVPKDDVDSRVKPVPKEAVVLHGVKDFSLAKLLAGVN